MYNAHVHFRTHAISRANGTGAGSTGRAAAYQTATTLVHELARLCSISLEHRKALNKGIVTDELRQELAEKTLFTAPLSEMEYLRREEISPKLREMFEAEGITLSERLTFYPAQNGVTIRDRGPGPKTADDPERKRRGDPGMRQTYRLKVEDGEITVTKQGGVLLSKAAFAEKSEKRGYWTIRDGNSTYLIREFTRRLTNPETGRREAAQKGLDVFGDKTFSYSKKQGVLASWLEVPSNAPDHVKEIAAKGAGMTQQDLQLFINEVEAADPSRDGRPAQSYELGFLRELSHEQNRQALYRFCEENFTGKGLAVLISIHEVQASDGKPNTHAHLLVPSRPWDAQGNFTVKGELLSNEKLVREWRKSWTEQLRNQLTQAGVTDVQIDHRTYAERGIETTPGKHLGYEAGNMEKRGEESKRGHHNRWVRHGNRVQEAIAGLLSDKRRPGKSAPKPKRDRLRSLGSVARAQSNTEDDAPRSKSNDERAAWQKFKRSVMTNFREDVRALDKRALKAMMNSQKQSISRRQLDAAGARYSLHKSSKELSEDLKDRDHDR